MNNSNSYRDILNDYVKSSGFEKAPEGFTQKVMQHIYLERNAYKPVKKKNYVPAVTIAIAGVLIMASLFFPSNTPAIIERLLPALNLTLKFPDLNNLIVLPKTVLYVIGGIVILTCFDALLRALFYRKKT
jgi:hypothetical protein